MRVPGGGILRPGMYADVRMEAQRLTHRVPIFAGAGALIVVTVILTMRLPREILPQVDEGVVVATLHLPEGTSIEETVRQAARLERRPSR